MKPRLAVLCLWCLSLSLACGRPEPTPAAPPTPPVGQDMAASASPRIPTATLTAPQTATSAPTSTLAVTMQEMASPTSASTTTPAPTPTAPNTATPTTGGAVQAAEAAPGACATDYLSRRRSHVTALTAHNPAPCAWHDAPLPPGVSEVSYPSGDLKLRAWLALPKDAPARAPAVVYFHGYFGLGWDEFAHC